MCKSNNDSIKTKTLKKNLPRKSKNQSNTAMDTVDTKTRVFREQGSATKFKNTHTLHKNYLAQPTMRKEKFSNVALKNS